MWHIRIPSLNHYDITVRFAERCGLTADATCDAAAPLSTRRYEATGATPPPGAPLSTPIEVARVAADDTVAGDAFAEPADAALPLLDGDTLSDGAGGGGGAAPSAAVAMSTVVGLVHDITGARAGADDRLVSLGIDSLNLLALSQRLRQAFGASAQQLDMFLVQASVSSRRAPSSASCAAHVCGRRQ